MMWPGVWPREMRHYVCWWNRAPPRAASTRRASPWTRHAPCWQISRPDAIFDLTMVAASANVLYPQPNCTFGGTGIPHTSSRGGDCAQGSTHIVRLFRIFFLSHAGYSFSPMQEETGHDVMS